MTTSSTDALLGPAFRGLPERARLARAAKELEAVVVAQLFETMRKTVPDGGLIERSAAEDVFRTMLDGELARVVADRSPFGLADRIVDELGRHLEADDGTPRVPPVPSGVAPRTARLSAPGLPPAAPPAGAPAPSPSVPTGSRGPVPRADTTIPPPRGWRA